MLRELCLEHRPGRTLSRALQARDRFGQENTTKHNRCASLQSNLYLFFMNLLMLFLLDIDVEALLLDPDALRDQRVREPRRDA